MNFIITLFQNYVIDKVQSRSPSNFFKKKREVGMILMKSGEMKEKVGDRMK